MIEMRVTLGDILTIIALLSGAASFVVAIKSSLAVITARFEDFKANIQSVVAAFSDRLDKHETMIIKVVGDVQRVVGRIDGDTRR